MLDILSSKLLLVLGDLSGEVTPPGAPAYSQSNYTSTEEKDKYSWLCLLSQKSVTSVKSLVLSREPETSQNKSFWLDFDFHLCVHSLHKNDIISNLKHDSKFNSVTGR